MEGAAEEKKRGNEGVCVKINRGGVGGGIGGKRRGGGGEGEEKKDVHLTHTEIFMLSSV